MVGERLTAAQRSLLRLLEHDDARAISRKRAAQYGQLADFDRCRRAGLIQSADYETSCAADDWLESRAGREALARQSPAQDGEGSR